MKDGLQAELAPQIAPLVLANLTTRYPYHDAHLYAAAAPPFDPIGAHPAFGNGYDWHSSVHSHWTALQLLAHFERRGERPPVARELHAAVVTNLKPSSVAAETEYLQAYRWYERPYGRAWALALVAAASQSEDAGVRGCVPALRALAETVASALTLWLKAMPGPVRHGAHTNTAYALGLTYDAARTLGWRDLERTVAERARVWFAPAVGYPHEWERSAHDFLSPGLAQADLLRRVLPANAFGRWWHGFLGHAPPDAAIFAPASVPNDADAQLVHLHGLNLSRAAMLARIAAALEDQRAALAQRALALYRAGAAEAFGAEYLSTHWLPTFAWDAARSLDALEAS